MNTIPANATTTSETSYLAAMCAKTGAILRAATADESAAYFAQPEKRPYMRGPVRISAEITITDHSVRPGNRAWSCGEN